MSAPARCLVSTVLLLGDVAVAAMWVWTASTATGKDHAMFLTGAASAVVAVICLVVVIVLNTGSGAGLPARTRGRAVRLLSLISLLNLTLVFIALLALGAYSDLNGVQVLIISVVEAGIVVWLAVGTSRHIASLAASP